MSSATYVHSPAPVNRELIAALSTALLATVTGGYQYLASNPTHIHQSMLSYQDLESHSQT